MRHLFATLIIVSAAGQSFAQELDSNFLGYLDANFSYFRNEGSFNDMRALTADTTTGGATAVMQYRIDNCAFGVATTANVSHQRVDYINYGSVDFDRRSLTLGAEAGCKIQDLWIVGLGQWQTGLTDNSTASYEFERRLYGGALDYSFNPNFSLGVMVARDHYYSQGYDTPTNLYGVKADYFFTDNLLLSNKLFFRDDEFADSTELSTTLEYKPQDWQVAFYGGVRGSYTNYSGLLPGNEAHETILGGTLGMRFYFNKGSLKAQHDQSLPIF